MQPLLSARSSPQTSRYSLKITQSRIHCPSAHLDCFLDNVVLECFVPILSFHKSQSNVDPYCNSKQSYPKNIFPNSHKEKKNLGHNIQCFAILQFKSEISLTFFYFKTSLCPLILSKTHYPFLEKHASFLSLQL